MSKDIFKLTVLLPVFNESPLHLSKCLDSLLRQKVPFRCLIIDESDSQDTIDFLAKHAHEHPNFEHIRPAERLGLVGSLNFGLDRCTTPYIARFDSDDVCIEGRFEKQIDYLEKNRDVSILGTQAYLINSMGEIIAERRYPTTHEDIVRKMNYSCPIAHPSVVFSVEALPERSLLKYDDGLRFAEDLDLWLRMADLGARFANLDEYLLSYRVSQTERAKAHWRTNWSVRFRNFKY